MKKEFLIAVLAIISLITNAQGLEDIIVEKYYVSGTDAKDDELPEGAVTYRIYVDMAPGYSLQTVFGEPGHILRIETTTYFFNHEWGAALGTDVNHRLINENTLALDSWLTIGAATKSHHGVLKSSDKDGSIIKRNTLSSKDGLFEIDAPELFTYELDLETFDEANRDSIFITDNSVMAVLGGIKGPTSENKVLIAQLTTNGELSFELNVQLGTDECGIFEQYVARDPVENEIQFEGLVYGNQK